MHICRRIVDVRGAQKCGGRGVIRAELVHQLAADSLLIGERANGYTWLKFRRVWGSEFGFLGDCFNAGGFYYVLLTLH